jgi:hypothetical protein
MPAKKLRRGRREYGVEDEAGNTLIDPSATSKGSIHEAAARLAERRGESVYVFEVGEDSDGTRIVVDREEIMPPTEPLKSSAQIEREIDEVLAKAKIKPISESSYLGGLRYKTEVYGPGGNRPIGEALSLVPGLPILRHKSGAAKGLFGGRSKLKSTASRKSHAQKKITLLKDIEPGLRNVAQRSLDAENRFIAYAMEHGRLSSGQAETALAAFRKARAIKFDAVNGTFHVKHGQFLEPDVLRRAAGIEE